ncbi:sulfotransferase 1 family member D1-like [Pelodytes ibericus]
MRGKLEPIDGVLVAETIAQNWQEIKAFQARPEDILIATYPKSGTTWVQEIVDLIMNNGDEEVCRRAPIYERIPFIDLMHAMKLGPEEINEMPSPRVLKTHLPVQLVPDSFWNHNCKVIYVARNARDTVTSYYHFANILQIHPEPGTFEQYLEKFMKGEVGWGSWYDHVKGYWDWKAKHNILYLFFEDLKWKSLEEIRKVTKFLDKDLSEDVLKKIVHLSSFNQMKINPMANYSTFPKEILDQSQKSFMRKGIVGDWKNHFTVQQSEQFEDNYHKQMHTSSLTFPSMQ